RSASIAAVQGTPQSATIGQAFALPLQVRVLDAFEGAAVGASVDFVAQPAGSGASATLSGASGSSDFDGYYQASATANAAAGSYSVVASANGFDASFALTNDRAVSTVTWDALGFEYTGNTHTVVARIADEPGTTCVVTPATIGP